MSASARENAPAQPESGSTLPWLIRARPNSPVQAVYVVVVVVVVGVVVVVVVVDVVVAVWL
jgi:hypothetical protein